MSLATDLRRLAGTAGVLELTVAEVRRDGEDLTITTVEMAPLVLLQARHQPRLFGAEPEEEDLAGTRLRMTEEEIGKLARRSTFIVVFHSSDESGRSYLCERAAAGT